MSCWPNYYYTVFYWQIIQYIPKLNDCARLNTQIYHTALPGCMVTKFDFYEMWNVFYLFLWLWPQCYNNNSQRHHTGITELLPHLIIIEHCHNCLTWADHGMTTMNRLAFTERNSILMHSNMIKKPRFILILALKLMAAWLSYFTIRSWC